MSAAKQRPWTVEAVRNADAEYGEGEESHKGFDAFQVVDANGRVLFDSLNRDPATSSIEEDHGEEATHAWDADAKRDLKLAAAAPGLLQALKDAANMLDHVSKREWGGNFPASLQEVRTAARAAISKAEGEGRNFNHEKPKY